MRATPSPARVRRPPRLTTGKGYGKLVHVLKFIDDYTEELAHAANVVSDRGAGSVGDVRSAVLQLCLLVEEARGIDLEYEPDGVSPPAIKTFDDLHHYEDVAHAAHKLADTIKTSSRDLARGAGSACACGYPTRRNARELCAHVEAAGAALRRTPEGAR